MTPGVLALRPVLKVDEPNEWKVFRTIPTPSWFSQPGLPLPSPKPSLSVPIPQGPAETARLPKAQGHFCPGLTTPTSHTNKARHSPGTQAGIWVSHSRWVSTLTSMGTGSW